MFRRRNAAQTALCIIPPVSDGRPIQWIGAWEGWRKLSPVLRHADFYTALPGKGFGPRFVQEFQILFVQSGTATATVDGRLHELSAGDLVFYGPRQKHQVVAGHDQSLRLIGLAFVFTESDEKRLSPGRPHSSPTPFRYPRGTPRCPLVPKPPTHISCGAISGVKRQCESLVISHMAGPDRRPMEKRGLLLGLFDLWHEAIAARGDLKASDIPLPHRRSIDDVQRSILNDPAHPPTLAQAAKLADLSTAYFTKLFRQRCGATLTQFIHEHRLLRARVLLVEGRLSVKEVAHAVGFEDPFYFSRCFTRQFGTAPSAMRNGQGPI